MRVTCPECDGTAHRLGESDVLDEDGNLLAARYVCHGDMELRQVDEPTPEGVEEYPNGEFYVDLRNSDEDGVRYVSQDLFGYIREQHGA